MTEEQKIAGSHYILSFYGNIQTLTAHYSNYLNVMIELQFKTNDNASNTSDQEKAIIQDLLNKVRYYTHISYIQYLSITNKAKITKDEKITELYNTIKNNYIVKRTDVEQIVQRFNDILVNEIIQDLLSTSRELVNSVYENEPEQPNTQTEPTL